MSARLDIEDTLLFEHTINSTCRIKLNCLIVPQVARQSQKRRWEKHGADGEPQNLTGFKGEIPKA